jgi:hypothetical protein
MNKAVGRGHLLTGGSVFESGKNSYPSEMKELIGFFCEIFVVSRSHAVMTQLNKMQTKTCKEMETRGSSAVKQAQR